MKTIYTTIPTQCAAPRTEERARHLRVRVGMGGQAHLGCTLRSRAKARRWTAARAMLLQSE